MKRPESTGPRRVGILGRASHGFEPRFALSWWSKCRPVVPWLSCQQQLRLSQEAKHDRGPVSDRRSISMIGACPAIKWRRAC